MVRRSKDNLSAPPGWCLSAALATLFLLMLLSGCAKKSAPSVVLDPLPRAPAQPVPVPSQSVRVLVAEGIGPFLVEGGEEGQALKISYFEASRQVGSHPVSAAVGPIRWHGTGLRLAPQAGRHLSLDGRLFRGVLEYFVNPVGRPVWVNEVEVEDYLRGVVPNELGPGLFPEIEALKAQTVAARTFTLAGLGQFARYGFDHYSDQRSQVYTGFSAEHPLSDRAVLETHGLLAVYQGELIHAFYSSTCGGLTASFEEVFSGQGFPYLRGGVACDDRISNFHTWEETIDSGRLRESLNRKSRLGELKEVQTLALGANGRTLAMRFVGTEGDETLGGLELRFTLGLRSHWLIGVTKVRDEDGRILQLNVQGRGWGHGVGLCQMGAVNMARQGQEFRSILRHYYPGVDIISIG